METEKQFWRKIDIFGLHLHLLTIANARQQGPYKKCLGEMTN